MCIRDSFNIVVGRITQNISVRFRIVIPYKLIYSNGAPDNNEDEICLFTVKPDWPMRYAVRIAIANFLTHDFNAVIIVGSPDIIILYAHLIEEPVSYTHLLRHFSEQTRRFPAGRRSGCPA